MAKLPNIIVRSLVILIAAMGLYFIALWAHNISLRLTFPYPIEHLEDAIFFHALRVMDGKPVYTDYNSGFASIIYAPAYFYLLAGLFKIFGPSIVTARVVSLLCSFSMLGMLTGFSMKRLKFPLVLIPPIIYTSLIYAHFAGYADVGRVDPLMTLLVLAGLFIIGDGRTGLWRILFGTLLVTLACYVKQPALAYLPFVYGFIIIRGRRNGIVSALVSLVSLVLVFLIANMMTDGWFGFYTLKVPMTHHLFWNKIQILIFGGLVHYPVRGFGYIILSTAIYFLFRFMHPKREQVNILEATLPGAFAATLVPFIKEGGYFQDFIPLYTQLMFILPLALSLKPAAASAKNKPLNWEGYHPAVILVLLGLTMHCAYSLSPWDEFPPKPDNIRIGKDYVEKIREIDGEILMPTMGYYAWLAGKDPGYTGVALTDLTELDIRPQRLIDDVRTGRYKAIILPDFFPISSYWDEDLSVYGYKGPTSLLKSPNKSYDLRPNIGTPPDIVYFLSGPTK